MLREGDKKYKSISLIFLIILFFLSISQHISSALSPKPKANKQGIYPVLRVIDGDTIVVSYHGKKEHIRLLRINTPEKGQYGYREATKAMKKLVAGRKVRLEFEIPGILERGGYGRILAYVWTDEINVNVEMVRLGWSGFWTKYGEGKYAEEFRKAEKEAIEAGRGLWREPIDKGSMILDIVLQWYRGINRILESVHLTLKRP